jgi:hypothetical protein
VCYVILGFVGHVVGIVRRHYWEASSSTIQNHSTTRTTHSFLYIDLTQPQVTSRLVHDPYSGLSPLSHPSHCLYSGRPASMSSIPDILSGVDLIPHLDSPASMTPSPRPGSPTQPGLGLGPGPHRSKTAPPPGPPPPPDFPSPVHAPLISSDASSPTQGDAAPTVPPPRTGALAANTASTSVSTSTSTPASASRPQVSPKHNPPRPPIRARAVQGRRNDSGSHQYIMASRRARVLRRVTRTATRTCSSPGRATAWPREESGEATGTAMDAGMGGSMKVGNVGVGQGGYRGIRWII